MANTPAPTPFHELAYDEPITAGMLFDAMHKIGEGVGFALSAALAETGLAPHKQTRIALALEGFHTDGRFGDPAASVIAGIVSGMGAQLIRDPEDTGPLLE